MSPGHGLRFDDGRCGVGSHRAPSGGWKKKSKLQLAAAGGVAALVVNGLLVWSGTSAAFTSSTSNPTNNWNAGSVAVSDDDSNAAMFNATGLVPGSTGTRCITVTYGGDLASTGVKLYVSASSGTLGTHLNVTVEEGSGGSFGSCTGFTSSSSIYTGTLANFASTSTAFASGVGSWAPSSSGATRTYRFTYTLDAATPSSMQSTTAGATFMWEAQG